MNVAGHHPAEHEHVAVREVDQLEDPVHERVAERDERVHRAVRDARSGTPCVKVAGSLTRLIDKPDEQEEDERAAHERTDALDAFPQIRQRAHAWYRSVDHRLLCDPARGNLRLPRA